MEALRSGYDHMATISNRMTELTSEIATSNNDRLRSAVKNSEHLIESKRFFLRFKGQTLKGHRRSVTVTDKDWNLFSEQMTSVRKSEASIIEDYSEEEQFWVWLSILGYVHLAVYAAMVETSSLGKNRKQQIRSSLVKMAGILKENGVTIFSRRTAARQIQAALSIQCKAPGTFDKHSKILCAVLKHTCGV